MTATLTTRQIAFRNAKRAKDEARNAIVARAMFAAPVDEGFEIDTHGRKVRLSKPSDIEIAHTLRGNRVLDSMEILEQLGADAFTKLVTNGSLRRDAHHNKFCTNNLYWITTKAADIYGIPANVTLAGGASVALVA